MSNTVVFKNTGKLLVFKNTWGHAMRRIVPSRDILHAMHTGVWVRGSARRTVRTVPHLSPHSVYTRPVPHRRSPLARFLSALRAFLRASLLRCCDDAPLSERPPLCRDHAGGASCTGAALFRLPFARDLIQE